MYGGGETDRKGETFERPIILTWGEFYISTYTFRQIHKRSVAVYLFPTPTDSKSLAISQNVPESTEINCSVWHLPKEKKNRLCWWNILARVDLQKCVLPSARDCWIYAQSAHHPHHPLRRLERWRIVLCKALATMFSSRGQRRGQRAINK